MDLTVAVLLRLEFEEIREKPERTFFRRRDNITLYEYSEPIWNVQLDVTKGEFSNFIRVITEEDLQNAINSRNIR